MSFSIREPVSDGHSAGFSDGTSSRRASSALIEPVRAIAEPPSPDRATSLPWTLAGAVGAIAAVVALGDGAAAIALSSVAVAVAGLSLYLLGRTRRALSRRDAEVRRVLAEAPAGCSWTWGPGDEAWFADAWSRSFGIDPGFAPDPARWLDRVHPEDIGALVRGLERVRSGAQHRLRHTYRVDDRGEWRFVEVHAVAIDTRSGVVLTGTAEDVTVRHQRQERLAYSAFHDALTGLPNRALFLDRLGHCHARAKRNPRYHFAVIFLDVDDFKLLNDSLGHHAGDEVLTMVARRIQSSVRPGDTVARIGGDEFTVLLEPLGAPDDVELVTNRVRAALHGPIEVSGHTVQLSTSVGVALSNPSYVDPGDLLRDADTAMFCAKHEGPGLWRRFDHGMHESAMRRLHVETQLRRGLESGGLQIYYQPIVSLVTGAIEGFEALARLFAEDGEKISPVEFIPLAESLGLVDAILDHALEDVTARIASWGDRHPRTYVSVNASARSLRPGLVGRIRGALARHGVSPRRIKLELTESVLVTTSPQATQQLVDLRDLGVGLYIDDFGTGYSSLSYLHQFPVDHIKLDRTFVSALDGSRMPDIVETIVTLSRRLGAAVIAEGVETKAQLASLRALQCTLGQGWLFAPALAPEEATRLLDEGKTWDVSLDASFSLPLPGI